MQIRVDSCRCNYRNLPRLKRRPLCGKILPFARFADAEEDVTEAG
jgi:hypothetical protein